MNEINWNAELVDQLTWHWDNQLRPRLSGLTDEEYLWEPVAGCWNLRRRGEGRAAIAAGPGAYLLDFDPSEPEPPPVTTIAWRIGHLLVGVFGARNTSHFGGPPTDYPSYDYPSKAADALAQLDEFQERWVTGVRALRPEDLAKPSGEHGYESSPMATLILHINREVLHHGAEIALLRDLYAWRNVPRSSGTGSDIAEFG